MEWEYRTETIDTAGKYLVKRGCYPRDDPWSSEEAEYSKWADINDLGREGWELVTVFCCEDSEASAIFKRPGPKAEKGE